MTEPAAVWRRAFIGASVLWALMLALAPWAAHRTDVSRASYACTFIVYGIGSMVCHQLPARSFQLWSMQMPVCARCTGIYLGAALAATIAGLCDHARVLRHARSLLIAAATPTALTLVFEWTTGVPPANWIRAAAGAPLGVVVAIVVVSACSAPWRGTPAPADVLR
jgi:uncharacterized membrane protein